ncbi:hypothetical protein [Paraburkholderia sp. J8-2]|uniref:hypothetical protein n=1 Tax=Paraburkholderia sp. J8-2 TaxID=2805440 RepID=UPI002AB6FC42|nr:hypothetical protein [Paraburkholderia sp. J8-2]
MNLQAPLVIHSTRNRCLNLGDGVTDVLRLHEIATDAKLTAILDHEIKDGTMYVLGTRANTDTAHLLIADLIYHYGPIDGEWSCCFDSMAEVGEPYRPWFHEAIRRSDMVVQE